MADNTTLPGTGEVYASDEVENAAGVDVNFQIVKLGHSEEGKTPLQASARNPFPVTGLETNELLTKILSALLINQMHLERITGELFTEEDIENDSY